MFFLVNFILTQYVGVVNTAPGRKSWGVEELAVLLAVGFSFRCCSTPFLWSCPKKRGGAPKKNAFGWWRPREVSRPTRLSHSRGSCHSAAKVSASRTYFITRPRGEGLGSDVDCRLKVFCPAFLQKSGRGPGAEPMAARRSARTAPLLMKRRRGSKGEPSPGVPPLRAAPAARSLCAPPWGWRWTKERVVEDADPYGGWETGRAPHNMPRDHPAPGRGWRNSVRPAVAMTAGRRGRRPLQGGCGDVGPATDRRPGGGGTPCRQGAFGVRAASYRMRRNCLSSSRRVRDQETGRPWGQ